MHGSPDQRWVRRPARDDADTMLPSAQMHGVVTPDPKTFRGSIAPRARTPVNASPAALTTPAHDSGRRGSLAFDVELFISSSRPVISLPYASFAPAPFRTLSSLL